MYKLTLFLVISWSIELYAQEKLYSYDENLKLKKFNHAGFEPANPVLNKTHFNNQDSFRIPMNEGHRL